MAAEVAAEEELRKLQKPQLAQPKAMSLAAELFGLELVEEKVKQLESYDDVNYYLRCADGGQYVFKVHNGVESDNAVFLEGMNALLLHLRKHGIAAPHPVNSLAGDWMTKVELPLRSGEPKAHAIRLLEFVDGEMMNASPTPRPLLPTPERPDRHGAVAGRRSRR